MEKQKSVELKSVISKPGLVIALMGFIYSMVAILFFNAAGYPVLVMDICMFVCMGMTFAKIVRQAKEQQKRKED